MGRGGRLWAWARLDGDRHDPSIATGRFTVSALMVSSVAVATFCGVTAVFDDAAPFMYAVAASYLLIAGATLGLVRAGHIQTATHVFILMTAACAVVFLWQEGPDSRHLGIFFVAIIMAGWLARPVAALVYGVVASVVIAVANLAYSSGAYEPVDGISQHAWLQTIAQLLASGALVALLVHSLHKALDELRQNQARRLAEERHRQQLELQLLKATKTEALGRLAGGVAHDVNNHLAVILMNASVLATHSSLSPSVRDQLAEVEEAALKAASVTQQLLAFGRKQHGPERLLDLRDIVRGIERMSLRLLGERIKLVIELPAEPCLIHADAVRVEQCVVNLVVNGHDAMPGGGVLDIAVVARELDAEKAASVGVEPGDWVVLEVRDTGVGMSAEQAARAFEPFFTTKDAGTGLGLSTLALVMSQLDGAATLTSTPDEGSTFQLYFPRAQGRLDETEPEVEPVAGGAGQLILLVDDDPTVRRSVRRALVESGFRVLEASDSEGALAHLDHDEPDLLLTDVVLQGESGATLAEAFQQRLPERPILFMSGYAGRVLEGHGVGAEVHLIQKPFDRADLVRRVTRLLT